MNKKMIIPCLIIGIVGGIMDYVIFESPMILSYVIGGIIGSMIGFFACFISDKVVDILLEKVEEEYKNE